MWGPSPAWLTRLLLDESDETEAARLLSQLVAQHLVRVRARVGLGVGVGLGLGLGLGLRVKAWAWARA